MNLSKKNQELSKNNSNSVRKKAIVIVTMLFTTLIFSQKVSEELKSAIKADNLEVFKTLIDVTDLDAYYKINDRDYTLLIMTIKLKADSCFGFLIENNVNLEKISSGKTPLMHAVKNGKLDMVKALITAGADKLAINDANKTALDYSVRYKRKGIQTYLESL